LSPQHSANTPHDDGEGSTPDDDRSTCLIGKAVRLSRIPRSLYRDVADLLSTVEKIDACSDSSEPPREFRDALRQPRKSKRRPIRVCIDGHTVPLLLNPQGRKDPEREQQVWNYIRGLVRDGVR
jgi:hypothetical protein